MSNRISNLKEYYLNKPEVIRIKELEHYIDSNQEINDTLNLLKDKQKQMVNAKEFNQPNQYKIYLDEYNEIRNRLLDLPFVEEYLELLEIVNQELVYFSSEVESKINKIING